MNLILLVSVFSLLIVGGLIGYLLGIIKEKKEKWKMNELCKFRDFCQESTINCNKDNESCVYYLMRELEYKEKQNQRQ